MRRAARLASIGAALVALTLCGLAASWRLAGGSFFAVRTASMGTAAPVGSLVLDRPIQRVSVGEVITFTAPGTHQIFTHRVVGTTATGLILTKGDVNGALDGWQLPRADVLGRVVLTLRDAGWLLTALPLLAIGGTIVWLLTQWLVLPEWRLAARASGLTLVAVLALTSLHVLVNASVITFADRGGQATGDVVSTGLLPLDVSAVDGTARTISEGQVARVATRRAERPRRYQLRVSPKWELWWFMPLAVFALLPALLSLTVTDPELSATAPDLAVIGAETC